MKKIISILSLLVILGFVHAPLQCSRAASPVEEMLSMIFTPEERQAHRASLALFADEKISTKFY